VRTVGGYVDFIIERNSPIPVEQTRLFTTTRDNQRFVRIQVCQGEEEEFERNLKLGEVVLSGLRDAARGEVTIAVTFEINTDGLLEVRARDRDTPPLPSRQLRRHQVQDIRQADHPQFFLGDLTDPVCVLPAVLDKGESDVFPDFQGVEERRVLEKHAEFAPDRVHVFKTRGRYDLTVDLDGTRIRFQDTDDALNEDALAHTALADNDNALPGPDFQVGPVQDDFVPEGFLQVPHAYGRLVTHLEQEGGKEVVGNEDEDGSAHHRFGGRPSHTLRAAFGIKTHLTTDEGDDHAEDSGFQDAYGNV